MTASVAGSMAERRSGSATGTGTEIGNVIENATAVIPEETTAVSATSDVMIARAHSTVGPHLSRGTTSRALTAGVGMSRRGPTRRAAHGLPLTSAARHRARLLKIENVACNGRVQTPALLGRLLTTAAQ